MIVESIKLKKSPNATPVIDCCVGKGYLQGESGSLPDVDIDYQSDRRQEVKEYLERRYNKNGLQRVFSAGTFTTMKLKAVLKDVARVHHVPVMEVNYINKIIDDDSMDFTGLFKLAYTNKKVKAFIETYPRVIEDIRTLMNQPRSSSIHASAIIITPEIKDGKTMECFDYLPVKEVDGVLVSEIDGYSIDEVGLLKNDCLGIKELTKLQKTRDLVVEKYKDNTTFLDIITNKLEDEKAYKLFTYGFTQNIFQFGSTGMTKFVMDMKPTTIHDLIAANALFRPATIESGSTENYVAYKNGDKEPVYLWGTYEIMKETFSLLVYQEQLCRIAQDIGGFSLAEGVHLVKYISKKKVDKILEMKDKFIQGAKEKGCPEEDIKALWHMIESGGSYLFNSAHATAYGLTAYLGAWYKANYPTAFYTVALEYAKDENISSLMGEMEQASPCKIVHPDINVSGKEFETDYQSNEIFWSLSRIKFVGGESVNFIIAERDKNGPYKSLEDFCRRIFKKKLLKLPGEDRCPVNSRQVKNLILSGCFDKVENALSVVERYALLQKASEIIGFEISEEDFPDNKISQHYFWSMLQITISGIGSVDYRRVYDNSEFKSKIRNISYKDIVQCREMDMDGKKAAICATIVEIKEKSYVDKEKKVKKTFAVLQLQQNNELIELILWSEIYDRYKEVILNAKDKMILMSCMVKWSDFSSQNTLQDFKGSLLEII